jgi:hypothetical protein
MAELIDVDTALKVAGAVADSLAHVVGAAANATWQGLSLACGIAYDKASEWLAEYASSLEAAPSSTSAIDGGWDEEL